SRPSAQMLLLLAEQLEIPFRERNHLLLAGGYAPAFPQRSLEDPELTPVREALNLILTGHEPYPAVVVDRYWNVVAGNSAMGALSAWVDPALLAPRELSFFATVATFGTAVEVTTSELSIELAFPADAATAAALRN